MPLKALEECIDLEIVKTEKRRLEIFLGVMFFGLILLTLNLAFFPVVISDVFKEEHSIKLGVYASVGFIILLFISRFLVNKLVHCGKPLPLWYKIYSITIDSTIPFLWLFFIIKWEENPIFLNSPLVFILPVIIIVSTLHMSFWLSFLNGFLIAVIYAVITFWSFDQFETAGMLPPIVYYTIAMLFLVAGICAGLVSRELKSRLAISIQTQEEKDQIEKLFSQQVSSQVADALKSEGDFNMKTEASVLFLDIRDFTQKVQFLSPEEVNRFQNRFFGPIIKCISKNEGLINQLMGDGLMATFISSEDQRHEEKAFLAASEILRKTKKMDDGSGHPIKVGIGIHCGQVIAGNIGNQERSQFSISGIPVITAARLEQLTRDFDSMLLVSAAFYQKVEHLAKDGQSMGEVKLKGLDQEIEVIKLA